MRQYYVFHIFGQLLLQPIKIFLNLWARKVEEESDGRLKVEIYPSATLSSADSTYESTANGTIDIGSQVQGYSNGRFPLTQIAELPGLSNSATQMNCMLQTLYDDGVISSEYEDTHLLFMMGTGPGGIHTIDNPIRKPEDLKGLRMRRPSAIAGDIIESAGERLSVYLSLIFIPLFNVAF